MKNLAELRHLFVCIFLFHFSAFMVIPAITDVTMAALCPGRDQCSLAIYLSGFQQAVTGLGTLVVTPIIGNLSDMYGRKALLTLPMTISVIPIVILAYDRSRPFFYAYYGIKTFTEMFSDGSMQCLSLAYVADRVCERSRASAFGVLSGVSAAGFVSGTIMARFLSTSSTFQVSAAVAVIAAAYMRALLSETVSRAAVADESCRPLCATPPDDGSSSPKLLPLRKVPSLGEMISLLRSSMTLTRVAIITFFCSLGENGLQCSLMYYLKAQFHFSKDQFADLLLIVGISGAFSQIFLYSISWASWVPYFSGSFIVLSVFIQPCIRSIVSKKVGSSEQGMAQGCITSVSSAASIVSPLVFTPLTAVFLSDDAPFNFKGFSILCTGFASLAAFALSITMRAAPSISGSTFSKAKHVEV